MSQQGANILKINSYAEKEAVMIEKKVRTGIVSDQDRFRREDTLAMTPETRIMTLIQLRNRQYGSISRRIRDSGIVSYRTFDRHVDSRSPVA
jgi:hypothetical protein